jgi:RNA polymerase sigma factor (sigma-70 family)
MATSNVIQQLRRTVLLQDGAGLSDGELLGCVVEHRDDAAFAALVKRHGPLVWGVCRRLLSHHDAEDAFQAAFLVLFRKGASIRPREMLANWLYGVAHQTALHARRTAARRRAREKQVAAMPEAAVVAPDLWDDLRPQLDQELSRLPAKYRVVIVLCDLEGQTRKEAARQLGLPEGTVASRLSRARAMLARQLTQRGAAWSGGAVPPSVVSSTIQAASLLATGQAAAVPVQVTALTDGVLRTMLVSKLKNAAAGLLLVALLGGAAAAVYRTQAAGQPKAPAATERPGQDGNAKTQQKQSGQLVEEQSPPVKVYDGDKDVQELIDRYRDLPDNDKLGIEGDRIRERLLQLSRTEQITLSPITRDAVAGILAEQSLRQLLRVMERAEKDKRGGDEVKRAAEAARDELNLIDDLNRFGMRMNSRAKKP